MQYREAAVVVNDVVGLPNELVFSACLFINGFVNSIHVPFLIGRKTRTCRTCFPEGAVKISFVVKVPYVSHVCRQHGNFDCNCYSGSVRCSVF